MNIIPTVLVRNEENYIADVLRPLVAVFGKVLLGDTGSNDTTPDIAASIEGVEVFHFGLVTPHEFTECRRELGRLVYQRGAEWEFLCDGDELYNTAALRHAISSEIPAHAKAGYTKMVTIELNDVGELYEMDDIFSRLAFMPALVKWNGDYPFDVPEVFNDRAGYCYFDLPQGQRYHAVHLHRLERSGRDGEVIFRHQKRKQFAMIDRNDVPLTVPFDMNKWLVN